MLCGFCSSINHTLPHARAHCALYLSHRHYVQLLLRVSTATSLLLCHTIQPLQPSTRHLGGNLFDSQGNRLEQEGQGGI